MITEERFEELFDSKEEDIKAEWIGDNAFQGLQIIAKYIDPAENDLIQGAGHDVIWSVNVEELVEAGITEDDVVALVKLNWMIEDGTYLACYV